MEVAEPEVTQTSRYQIERTLGAGGMGIVYLARDCKLHRPVAIKKLRSDATSASAQARIQSEARLLAKLNHRNIVQLYDVLEEDGKLALVMEYVEGTTLREWMREHRAGLREKLALLMQICEGLSEAHAVGIIHRDLKPDNILITHSGVPKITDFGIAKSQHLEQETLTQEDHVAGTVSAMSPEQIQGKTLDARSDLFSLGTIAYELLCGTKPFEKDEGGSLALANRIVSEAHIPPAQAWANIPEPLAVLLDKLLSKNPTLRPESAQLVYQALELLHRQGSDSNTEEFTATLTELLTLPRKRLHHRIAAAAAVVAIGAGAFWGWNYLQRLEPQYIAVLPVQITGDAPALTNTMVRQALVNAATQLKSSALVAFEPKFDQDLQAQLKELQEKGVTDALVSRLQCAQTRCEIEIERLNPSDNLLKGHTSFTILTNKRQESGYQITGAAAHLFGKAYHKSAQSEALMEEEDYSRYLEIVARSDSKDLDASDLRVLEELVLRYPDNANLYRAHIFSTGYLYVASDNFEHIQSGLAILERAKLRGIQEVTILELELFLRTFDSDRHAFDRLLPKLLAMDFPPAQLLSKYARFLYMQGEYKDGLQYARDAAELTPSAENLYLIAMNQFGSGGYQQAAQTLAKITTLHPEHWPSYATLGAIQIEIGNYTAAETTISSIPSKLRNWRTLSNLGVAYFLQKKYIKALETHEKVLLTVRNDIPTIDFIAEVHLMLGNTQKAQENFNKLLQLTRDKEGLEARRYHTLALANLGGISEAIPLMHQLLQEAPDDTDIKYTAAQIYALAEEYRSANYYIEQLLGQGMSADWFSLPIFRQLCTQEVVSEKVKISVCR